MSERPPADGRGSLAGSMVALGARLVGFDLRTTVEATAAATRLTAEVLDEGLRYAVNTVAARLDVQQLAERVDVDALAARVDVDALAARVDLDTLAARVDMNALAARVDTVGLARHVIDAIDLPEIIRESTGTMATEAVGGIRLSSMHADEAVANLVDRLIRRNGHRTAPTRP